MWNQPLQKFIRHGGILQHRGPGPKTSIGLAEVPSLTVAIVAALLGDALDFLFSSGGGMRPFFLASDAVLPFLKGKTSRVSSLGHFSPITTPFAARFVVLPPPPPRQLGELLQADFL